MPSLTFTGDRRGRGDIHAARRASSPPPTPLLHARGALPHRYHTACNCAPYAKGVGGRTLFGNEEYRSFTTLAEVTISTAMTRVNMRALHATRNKTLPYRHRAFVNKRVCLRAVARLNAGLAADKIDNCCRTDGERIDGRGASRARTSTSPSCQHAPPRALRRHNRATSPARLPRARSRGRPPRFRARPTHCAPLPTFLRCRAAARCCTGAPRAPRQPLPHLPLPACLPPLCRTAHHGQAPRAARRRLPAGIWSAGGG